MAKIMGEKLKVFISYSRPSDIGNLRLLVKHLTDNKCEVLIDFDGYKFVNGSCPTIHNTIENMIKVCDIALLLYSWQFTFSDYCQHIEIPELLLQGKPLYPIIFENDGYLSKLKGYNTILVDSNSSPITNEYVVNPDSVKLTVKQMRTLVDKGLFGRLSDLSYENEHMIAYNKDGNRCLFSINPDNILSKVGSLTKEFECKPSFEILNSAEVPNRNNATKESVDANQYFHLFYYCSSDKVMKYILPDFMRDSKSPEPVGDCILYNYTLYPVGQYVKTTNAIEYYSTEKNIYTEFNALKEGGIYNSALYKDFLIFYGEYVDRTKFNDYLAETFTILVLMTFFLMHHSCLSVNLKKSKETTISKLPAILFSLLYQRIVGIEIFKNKHFLLFTKEILKYLHKNDEAQILELEVQNFNKWLNSSISETSKTGKNKYTEIDDFCEKLNKLTAKFSHHILHPKLFKIS